MIIDRRTTYDCAPSLTDADMLQFTKTGYLALPAVVPDEINSRCCAFLEQHALEDHSAVEAAGAVDGKVRIGRVAEPMELLGQAWFVDQVLCCPAVVGAVRSLLGAEFGLPILISNHRMTPENTPAEGQSFHHDGGSQFNAEELHYLQVFYYPAECTPEMGPTELVPGTHWGECQGYPPVAVGPLREPVRVQSSHDQLTPSLPNILCTRPRSPEGGSQC